MADDEGGSQQPHPEANAAAEKFNDDGNDLYDEGDLHGALESYSKAICECPRYSWAYCNRAAVHLAMENIVEAIEDYTSAIKIDDTDSALFNGRGFAYMTMEPPDLEAAMEDVDMAIMLEDENGAAHCTRGALLKLLAANETKGSPKWTELIDDAIKHERKAIELEPEAQEPKNYLQELLHMQGITDDSIGRSSVVVGGPVPERPDTMPEGFLHKKGGLKDNQRNWIKGGRRNWKQRWFVFEEGPNGDQILKWLDADHGKQLGTLEKLSDCKVEVSPDDSLKFCMRSDSRDLWLKADTQAVADRWIRAMRSCTEIEG